MPGANNPPKAADPLYLVTGGAGFIGSNIVTELVHRGVEVRALDDFSNGMRSNLETVAENVEVIDGDIRDPGAVRRAAQGADVVLHLAALGSVPRSVKDPKTSNDVNVGGTLNVLIAARDAGVGRVVYSSSSSVYGDNPALPKQEDMATRPVSPYAASKLAGENYTRAFAEVYGMETVSLRYFNVFGPRQRPDSPYAAVIPLFMNWAASSEPLVVHGDGLQSRDFTYVDNVVSANLLAATAGGVSGRVFNTACGTRYSLLDIVASLGSAAGRELETKHVDARPGDVKHSEADISAARDALGYEVVVDFSEGLARTWDAYLADWQS